jgi:hypothetical protein
VALASRGARDLDGGEESIGDQAVLAQIRRQARKVYLESFALAALVTAAVELWPGR